VLREFEAGDHLGIGPLQAETCLLPHWVPHAGVRLAAGGRVLAYTGDSGPDAGLADLAHHADLLLAEATYMDEVPEDSRYYLSSPRSAGRLAADGCVGRLLLTPLWPGTDAPPRTRTSRLRVRTIGRAVELVRRR
jgi:ribonuclease BN (tRNA processing enzyme)